MAAEPYVTSICPARRQHYKLFMRTLKPFIITYVMNCTNNTFITVTRSCRMNISILRYYLHHNIFHKNIFFGSGS